MAYMLIMGLYRTLNRRDIPDKNEQTTRQNKFPAHRQISLRVGNEPRYIMDIVADIAVFVKLPYGYRKTIDFFLKKAMF